MRTGVIATQDGTRLAYVLNLAADLIQQGQLEERVRQLEAQIRGES